MIDRNSLVSGAETGVDVVNLPRSTSSLGNANFRRVNHGETSYRRSGRAIR